jgi:hypothetical protein
MPSKSVTRKDKREEKYTKDRYRGKVSFVHLSSKGDTPMYGYIKAKSVEPIGKAPRLNFKEGEDIYVRVADRSLRKGMELVFGLIDDLERDEGCYRAFDAKETSASRYDGMANAGVTLGTPSSEVQDSTTFMSFCVLPSGLAKIREAMLEKKTVAALLMVQYRLTDDEEHPTQDEKRSLVKLDATVPTMLSFNSSGKHRIVALVVTADNWSGLNDYYLSTSGGKYKTSIISHQGDCLHEHAYSLCSGSVDLVVPAEIFAPRPSYYGWVNAYFKKPPKDECRMWWRHKAICVLQFVRIPWIAVKSFVKFMPATIGALALFCVGMRGIAFWAFAKHPYTTPVGYVWENLEGSRFWQEKNGKDFILPFVFSPALWILVLVAALYIYGFGEKGTSGVVHLAMSPQELLTAVGTLAMYIVGIVATVAAVLFWAEGVAWTAKFTKLGKAIEARRERRKEARRKAFREKEEQLAREREAREQLRRQRVELEVRNLMCATTGPVSTDVSALPYSPKTIYLKFFDWKRKRCRNFSAG